MKQLTKQKERGKFLSEYWRVKYYHDNKELNYKIFKPKAAYLLNELDKQLFEYYKIIFGHKFTTSIENQILINDIKKPR